jgi:hypothetical protein
MASDNYPESTIASYNPMKHIIVSESTIVSDNDLERYLVLDNLMERTMGYDNTMERTIVSENNLEQYQTMEIFYHFVSGFDKACFDKKNCNLRTL